MTDTPGFTIDEALHTSPRCIGLYPTLQVSARNKSKPFNHRGSPPYCATWWQVLGIGLCISFPLSLASYFSTHHFLLNFLTTRFLFGVRSNFSTMNLSWSREFLLKVSVRSTYIVLSSEDLCSGLIFPRSHFLESLHLSACPSTLYFYSSLAPRFRTLKELLFHFPQCPCSWSL